MSAEAITDRLKKVAPLRKIGNALKNGGKDKQPFVVDNSVVGNKNQALCSK